MDHKKDNFHPKIFIAIVLILLALSAYLIYFSVAFQSVFANSQPVFHPGYGTATIDGIIDPTEWASADSLTLPMYGADPLLYGTFYVMQNTTDLFLGFTIDDDEYTQDLGGGKYSIYGDMMSFDFDDNNNSTLFEAGENKISILSYNPYFKDYYFIGVDSSAFQDIADGGMINGLGASTRFMDDNHFEVSFPLCSGDTGHDFCLHGGDILGFRIEYFDAFIEDSIFDFDSIFYPGTVDDKSLALIEIGSFANVFLPLVLR